MNNIGTEHLSRTAYVYVRQSTPGQLTNNPESRRRQYGLKDRAHALGWQDVVVIDDDLGRTASGTQRLGFEQLLTAVCTNTAGAVFAIEASRLARNGRDWHTLLEFCGLMNCLIVDEDGVYDPKQANDRLLLGMKGVYSELELSVLRQRSQEALRVKAARGDLHRTVAVGYVRSTDDRIEMDPDEKVQNAIHLIFRKLVEFGSARQVVLWLRDEAIKVPRVVYTLAGRVVEWGPARYNAIYRVLTNPIYAGTYVYGRSGSQVRIESGRKRISRGIRRPQDKWDVLIHDHHKGYISWNDYEGNQRIISSNANMKGAMVKGSVRKGGGLLAGLLRCGHCGRKLNVLHNNTEGSARYVCRDAGFNHGYRAICISFNNLRIDAAVSKEVLRVIAPLGLEAAMQAITDREVNVSEHLKQKELALEQARYEAARAHRQYNAADPDNRLVTRNLERLWNERLEQVSRLENELAVTRARQPPPITEAERAEILALGSDLPLLWNHPDATVVTRKRILRTLLEEIVVIQDSNRLYLKLHWKGGDHTALEVPRNRAGQHRYKTSDETEKLIVDLARHVPDQTIASILNRLGVRTAKGHTWTQQRVAGFRCDHQIPVYREGERAERGEVILQEAVNRLGVSKMTVIRMIQDGLLPARQICSRATYVIREADLNLPAVQRAIKHGRAVSRDPRQGTLDFQ
jgi:DNA invertase Pin-like site-specific DNA recombinase